VLEKGQDNITNLLKITLPILTDYGSSSRRLTNEKELYEIEVQWFKTRKEENPAES